MIIEPKKASYDCLVEALRRFECFAVRLDSYQWTLEDLQRAWTGLGTKTAYQQAVKEGFMTVAPRTTAPPPRAPGWWALTELGAKVVMEWHCQGYTVGDGWVVKPMPPRKVEID